MPDVKTVKERRRDISNHSAGFCMVKSVDKGIKRRGEVNGVEDLRVSS